MNKKMLFFVKLIIYYCFINFFINFSFGVNVEKCKKSNPQNFLECIKSECLVNLNTIPGLCYSQNGDILNKHQEPLPTKQLKEQRICKTENDCFLTQQDYRWRECYENFCELEKNNGILNMNKLQVEQKWFSISKNYFFQTKKTMQNFYHSKVCPKQSEKFIKEKKCFDDNKWKNGIFSITPSTIQSKDNTIFYATCENNLCVMKEKTGLYFSPLQQLFFVFFLISLLLLSTMLVVVSVAIIKLRKKKHDKQKDYSEVKDDDFKLKNMENDDNDDDGEEGEEKEEEEEKEKENKENDKDNDVKNEETIIEDDSELEETKVTISNQLHSQQQTNLIQKE